MPQNLSNWLWILGTRLRRRTLLRILIRLRCLLVELLNNFNHCLIIWASRNLRKISFIKVNSKQIVAIDAWDGKNWKISNLWCNINLSCRFLSKIWEFSIHNKISDPTWHFWKTCYFFFLEVLEVTHFFRF